jgi:hypothetical protein
LTEELSYDETEADSEVKTLLNQISVNRATADPSSDTAKVINIIKSLKNELWATQLRRLIAEMHEAIEIGRETFYSFRSCDEPETAPP